MAKAMRLRRGADAKGRCFATSLDLAWRAREQLQIDVALVTWRVRGDPCYGDHWAVLLNSRRAIDLTRVQVDGKRQIICPLGDYPANFDRLRIYPAALLLPAYERARTEPSSHLPFGFMWRSGFALLRFDLARAWKVRDAQGCAQATLAFLRFAACLGVAESRRQLNARADDLCERLRAVNSMSGTTT